MRQAPKSLRVFFLTVLVVGQSLCMGFGPPRLAAHDIDDSPFYPEQVRELARMVPPDLEAHAGLLLDLTSGAVLLAKNEDQRLAPASTTKMMTALVALEHGDLDDLVTVQAADLTTPSYAGLVPGETWTLEEILHALLLSSDNAAALVIARHIAGSVAQFVALMNEQAAEWGMLNTHFVNPHGFDDPQHYSSARDLAEIARHGLENPAFARIVATQQYQAGPRTLVNLNQLLESYEGAEGIKTGTTDEAGQCLVALVRRPAGQVLSVVLGSTDRYRDSRLLLDYYYRSYITVPLGLGPQGLNRVHTVIGEQSVLVLEEDRRVLLPRWQLPWLRTRRVVPGSDGDGEVRFTVGRSLLAEISVSLVTP